MGDDNALPLSKKRAAGREISRDNPGLDDELDVSESELGTFKKANDEVLASRRIIKVRRQPTAPSSNPTAPSSNPFAGIRLVPPVLSESRNELQANAADERATTEVGGKAEVNKETDGDHRAIEEESEEKSDEAVDVSSADRTKVGSDDKAAEDESTKQQQTNGKVEKEAEARAADEKAPEIKGEETDEARTVDDQGGADGDNAVDEDEKRDGGDKSKDDDNINVGDNAINEDGKRDGGDKGEGDNSYNVGAQTTPFSSFQQLSSNTNAFTGLAGTGFSSSFSFGSVSKDGSTSIPAFGFGTSGNGTTLFSATKSSENKNEGTAFPSMQEVSVQTGEENEDTVFAADSALFEFVDGGWKERGKGELKLNVSNTGAQKSRLVMRARGNYRLILNAGLYPDIKLTKMEKKGITFACVNSATEGGAGLATFALKFKDPSLVVTFSSAVTSHKGEAGTAASAQKTPDNSPKATDEA